MAESEKEKDAKQLIVRVGKQLAASKKCPTKDTLIKLLKQSTSALPELKQSDLLKSAVKPLSDSLIRHGLLHNEDKDVSLLVSICMSEIIRVLAPNPDFSKTIIRDIFGLFLRMFSELGAVNSPYFLRRVELLKMVARLKFCLLMLDTGEDLVLKMFKILFSVERVDHDPSLINSMSSIITCILEEKLNELDSDAFFLEESTPQPLLDVVLQNLIKEKKDTKSPGLAVTVIMNSGEKLEHYICQFLTSCILNRDNVGSVAKDYYHEIILKIFQYNPDMLLLVIPNITHELLTDQVDVRIKALNLFKKILASCGKNIAQEYPHVFTELLNRFYDKSADVRITAVACAKAYCMSHQSGRESLECLSAIQGRLLDQDEKVRTEAVNGLCELVKINLNFASPELISLAAGRLRDKKVLVRSNALKSLVDLYQVYCTSRAVHLSSLEVKEHIEEIPCKLLMLCYEKDCQDFRPQSMELKLADLFPASLSIEERTRHWIYMFSIFTPPHLKALRMILSQKRRLRDGLQDYLNLWNRTEENSCAETEKKMEVLIEKMSSCFPDPAKAKSVFEKLNELKDDGIFTALQQFLNKDNTLGSDITKDECLRRLGDRNTSSEFFNQLAKKCSFNIFGHKHVQCILSYLSDDGEENEQLKKHSMQLLLIIIGAFPSLLSGVEKQFEFLLLEKRIPFDDHLLEILAREGCRIPIKFSNIYAFLEKVCLEGTRAQSKLAISAIAALAETPEHYIFSQLCKKLVDSLCDGQNVPTLLQSLGCLAQYSISTFEAHEKVITRYIIEEVFQQDDDLPNNLDSLVQTSECCSSCQLKVFGLKTLVRSFLPHKCTSLTRPISFLLDIIQKMLEKGGCPGANFTCEGDEAHMKLVAAKSVLWLSRKWDLHISPRIFHLTVLMAKDPSTEVRRSLVSKVHKFLKIRALPCRYACAFSFVAFDSLKDLREDALKYLKETTWNSVKGIEIHESIVMQGAANHPVYLVVYLIHVLAHDTMFPSPDCEDEKAYARFLSPLFITLEVLVNGNLAPGKIFSASSYLRRVLIAIKMANDAVDDKMTMKLHLLAEVGISILNSLDSENKAASCSPGTILLPSSLYKSGLDAMKEANVPPLISYKTDASFAEKLVSILKTEIGSSTEFSKQNFQNSLRPSGIRHKESNPKSTRADSSLLANKRKEPPEELHTVQKQQASRTSRQEVRSGPDQIIPHNSLTVLNEKFSAENRQVRGGSKISEVEHPLLESSTSKYLEVQRNIVSSSSREIVVSRCSNVCIEPSNSSRASGHVNHSSPKNVNPNGDSLVGKHIKLWSPGDNCYHSGIVDTFDSIQSTHKITYDSGKVDILSLDGEKWEIDMDSVPTSCIDSSPKDQTEIPDGFGCAPEHDNMPKRSELCVRKGSQNVKRNKRCKDAIDACISEVIDVVDTNAVAKRTRSQRQKV